MLTAACLDRGRFEVEVWCGPQTGSEGSLIEACRRRGVAVRVFPHLVRELSPVQDALVVLDLTRAMRAASFEVVHTHSSKAGIVGRAAARAAGVPHIVHTVHGWGFHDRTPAVRRRLYGLLERWAARFTERLITVSERDIRKGLSEGIGTREQYRTIRSAIELDPFRDPPEPAQTRRDLGIPGGSPLVITVGRISEQKDPATLLAVARRVHARRSDIHYLWVGDGPMRQRLEEEIARLGLADLFHVLGLRDDVPKLLAAADVFLLTSRWEGLPRVLPQAMAAGLPVVATAVDGSPEAVSEGETGYLCPPGDVEALAARLLHLIENPTLARAMGRAGRERVTPEFDVRDMVSRIAALYDEILQPGSPRTSK